MSPWDTAALIPCVREAGGIATDLTGKTDNLTYAGSLLTSSSQRLHDHVLSTLAVSELTVRPE